MTSAPISLTSLTGTRSIDAAVLKAATQARKYLDKRQHHKNGETLVELEMKNAEKAKAVSEE